MHGLVQPVEVEGEHEPGDDLRPADRQHDRATISVQLMRPGDDLEEPLAAGDGAARSRLGDGRSGGRRPTSPHPLAARRRPRPAPSATPAPEALSCAARGSGTLGDRRQPVARTPAGGRGPRRSSGPGSARVIGPTAAVADRSMVELDDRRDLDAGPAQEHLVGDVELGAVDRPDLDAGSPGRAASSIMASRVTPSRMSSVTGGVITHAVADHEEVRGGAPPRRVRRRSGRAPRRSR